MDVVVVEKKRIKKEIEKLSRIANLIRYSIGQIVLFR